jgi:cell wall-associated NlpC family hydrolase
MVDYRALLGRQWNYGKNDCYSLLREYYGLLGIDLPDFPRPESLERTESIFFKHAQAIGFKPVFFEDRRKHDVLIMRLGTSNPMHAAIYVGGDRILHQRMNSLSATQPLSSYYRKSVAAVFRHAASPVGG